jgi:hypothetical protein
MKEKSLVEQAHGHLRETQDEHGNDISRIFELFKLLMGILKTNLRDVVFQIRYFMRGEK